MVINKRTFVWLKKQISLMELLVVKARRQREREIPSSGKFIVEASPLEFSVSNNFDYK